MNPAMIISWIFGILLIHEIGIDNFGFLWLQLKFIFVIILTIYHFFLFQCLRKFVERNNSYSPKFYRIINEIPTILLIGIIMVVVFKPL
jgi:protoporphyrinogen IX oxidase